MPDALFVVGKDGNVRDYLGGASGDTVLKPDQMAGKHVDDVWPADVAVQIAKGIRRVLKTRKEHAIEARLCRDDTPFSYEVRLVVQGRDRLLMIVRNTTELNGRPGAVGDRNSSDTLTGLTASDVFKAHFDTMIADAKGEMSVTRFCR